jgi:hypothetical protein
MNHSRQGPATLQPHQRPAAGSVSAAQRLVLSRQQMALWLAQDSATAAASSAQAEGLPPARGAAGAAGGVSVPAARAANAAATAAPSRAPASRSPRAAGPVSAATTATAAAPGPVAAFALEVVDAWWNHHPLQAPTRLAGALGRNVLMSWSREHPWRLVGGAAVAGAAAVGLRPWRWALRRAVLGAVLSQLGLQALLAASQRAANAASRLPLPPRHRGDPAEPGPPARPDAPGEPGPLL